jgi:ATP-dependent DNA ligase
MVAQIEFLEWTEHDRLRHSKFVGLREDKDAQRIVKDRPLSAARPRRS